MQDITQCSKDKPVKHSKVLKLPMYGCKLHFLVVEDIITEVNNLYRKLKINEFFVDASEGCLVNANIDAYYLVIDIKYLSHNTIAHEIFHATREITENRDIKDDEQQAWLCGWITENMYNFIKKKGLELK